ncbi:MAG: nuclear transport factor 2 family protein [Alphaproteobacteria bacterium]
MTGTEKDPSGTRAAARAYGAYLENLTPETLTRLGDYARSDVVFQDPFNHVTGREALSQVFKKMFEDVGQPGFRVTHLTADDGIAFIAWRFSFVLRNRPVTIEGVSELHIDKNGKVFRHIDYWDAARHLYEKLPLIGALLRRIRRRLATRP